MANFTRQAIKQAFLSLLENQPLSKITVCDITRQCGIHRNSFYYHFQDISQLLTEIITEQTDEIISRYPTIRSVDECFEAVFRTAKLNERALRHIYESGKRNLYTQQVMVLCGSLVERYLATAFPDRRISDEDHIAIVRVLNCQLYGMCIEWAEKGFPERALEDLQRVLELCRGVPELIVSNSRSGG